MTQIAQTILTQMGGNKFRVMTGAKNFRADATGLRFQLPAKFAKKAIRNIHVEYVYGDDLYNMTFLTTDGREVTKFEGVYCGMLQQLFTDETGLDTHL